MNPVLMVLRDLVVLAGSALVITVVFERLRIPAVTGFILAGAVIGPGGLGLVHEVETVRVLAEIGVVLLLFTLGLELSLPEIRQLGAPVVRAGALQIALTALLVTAPLLAAGVHPAQALFFGFLVSLSSSALILKLLTDRGELQSSHGRVTVGIAVLQDLALVPLTLLTALLGAWAAGATGARPELGDPLRVLFLAAAGGLGLLVAGRFVPLILKHAARARSRETFLAAVVVVVLGSAYLTAAAGLSLALGALVAGLLLSGSELRAQMLADIMPLRDAFMGVFFVSVGMLFSPEAVRQPPHLLLGATLGIVAVKVVAAVLACRLARIRWSTAIGTGLSLASVGELSFVLAQGGIRSGLLPDPWADTLVLSAMFSVLLAPWLVRNASDWSLRLDLWRRARFGRPGARVATPDEPPRSTLRSDHVVIAGYGLNGRNVARVLRTVRIPHVVVDHSADHVAACQMEGSPALLGNAAQTEILREAGVPRARCLVVALSDPISTRHVVRLGRSLGRHMFVIVRTRYVREMDALHTDGANVVIPEEFETSIEIFTAVLREYHVPDNIMEAQVEMLRRERYSLLRGIKLPYSVVQQLDVLLIEGTTETALILQRSAAVGRTLAELGLAGEDATARAVAVVRGGHAVSPVPEDFRLNVGDTLVLVGAHAAIDAAMDRLTPELA